MIIPPWIWTWGAIFVIKFLNVLGHGRLIEPPSRASMWRYGFATKANYNDNELFCGGLTRQWVTNKGKCGICGDPWDSPQPRMHEAGGTYGQGVIVRKYKMESAMTIRVELTANHRGYFEFRLCPNNAPKKVATQQCLDKYVLKRLKTGKEENDFHETRYYPGTENKVYEIKYSLPNQMTCSQCVLQWRYIAGNNWGVCPNGTGAVGCGNQEEFRACADIAIQDGEGNVDGTPYTTEQDNEIPVEGEQDDYVAKPETNGSVEYVLFLGTMVLLTLFLSLATVAALYFYYHHPLRKWWQNGPSCWNTLVKKVNATVQKPPPVPPPRTKKPVMSSPTDNSLA